MLSVHPPPSSGTPQKARLSPNPICVALPRVATGHATGGGRPRAYPPATPLRPLALSFPSLLESSQTPMRDLRDRVGSWGIGDAEIEGSLMMTEALSAWRD